MKLSTLFLPFATPVKAALSFAAIAAVAWAGFAGYHRVGNWEAHRAFARDSVWKVRLAASHDSTKKALDLVAQRDSEYSAHSSGILVWRNRIIHDTAYTNNPLVRACFDSIAVLDSSCKRQHDADTAAIHRVQGELAVALAKPDPPKPRRLAVYGEMLYGLTIADSAGHPVAGMAPVFRVGSTFRVAGSVSLSAAGQLSIPPAGHSGVSTQVLGGVRIGF